MTKKNEKSDNKQENKQPVTITAQVELSDEQLEQVTGGFNPQPDPPGVAYPPGPSVSRDGVIIDY